MMVSGIRSSNRSKLVAGKILLLAAPAIVSLLVAWSTETRLTIFLVGDSTMADKPVVDNPERGWGQLFPFFFGNEVIVENHAKNGRSTKSFINEGRWQSVVQKLKAGDYVFIQFGHNDEKAADTTRYAEAHTSYKQNLIRFVSESREKGAFPVLLTPVQRYKYDQAGKIAETHGDYPAVVREIAQEQNVPLVDLAQKSKALFEHVGAEESKKMFLHVRPGTFGLLADGKEDNTHFTEYGALKIAALVAEAINESGLPLKSYLQTSMSDTLIGLNKIVALDYYYNSEWKQVGGKRVQFHYLWEDTANSGFSKLGKVIDGLGAYEVALHRSPTRDVLSRYGIYIIVDPDTPAETEHPNFIEDSAAEAIAQWVKGGGVLMLMGNDKGNAEFEHLNRLAVRFGIHFNEDSYHRVVGTDFDSGKSSHLPNHPIFAGVKQIYLKEICSLAIAKPAEPVLIENDKVFMAVARFGKGVVFAVGDPWLYNEYVDSQKLPDSYENLKAGRNLFRWLLEQAMPTMN